MSAFYRIVLLLSVAVASVASVALVAAHRSQREKRSLMDLANEILCVMDSSPLDYMMYGCYCGVGGQGWPRDATDWCCFKHDCCYGGAEEDGCETKTKSYSWDCVDHSTKCDDLTNGSCDERVCECDSNFVKCLNESTYINKYRMWPNFFCNETKPTCDN